MSTIIASDTPTHFSEKDIDEIGEGHFRLNMGCGFGLDVVLLGSQSLAFRSYGGALLDLKSGTGWPGDLFNPVVGKA